VSSKMRPNYWVLKITSSTVLPKNSSSQARSENCVLNSVSPKSDFSTVCPRKIVFSTVCPGKVCSQKCVPEMCVLKSVSRKSVFSKVCPRKVCSQKCVPEKCVLKSVSRKSVFSKVCPGKVGSHKCVAFVNPN